MGTYNKELEEFLNMAQTMGIKVEQNSSDPGLFIKENNVEYKVETKELFNEFEAFEYLDDDFILDECDIELSTDEIHYEKSTVYSFNFKSNNLSGAA